MRNYLERNWAQIGPSLVGRIHVVCGDMDNYYLNLATYLLEDFLEHRTSPHYGGSFQYGRPLKGHGWQPTSAADLVQEMAEHIARSAPAGEPLGAWHY